MPTAKITAIICSTEDFVLTSGEIFSITRVSGKKTFKAIILAIRVKLALINAAIKALTS